MNPVPNDAAGWQRVLVRRWKRRGVVTFVIRRAYVKKGTCHPEQATCLSWRSEWISWKKPKDVLTRGLGYVHPSIQRAEGGSTK